MKRFICLLLMILLLVLTACGLETEVGNTVLHSEQPEETEISETMHTRYFTSKAEDLIDSEEIRKTFDRYIGLVEISDRIDKTSICANFDVYDYDDFTLEVLNFVCTTKEFPKYCVYTMATIQPEKELNNFKISHSSQDENAQLVSFFPYSVYNDYIGPLITGYSISTGEIKDNPNSIYWTFEWENSNKDKYYWENASGIIDNAPQISFTSLSVYTAESDSMVCEVETSFVMGDTNHKCMIDFSYMFDEKVCKFAVE